MELAEKIKNQGYIYKGYPESITKRLSGIEKKLGIPLMKSVYRHSMMDKEERAKWEAADKLRKALYS